MPFTVAALGGDVKVETLKETLEMKIPAGTQSGKVFRMKGQGMPDLHARGSEYGDLYVQVMLSVPTHLNSRQRELLEEFARESGEATPKGFKEKLKKAFK